ncbi:ABC transporter ATP-binding protein [Actinomadura sp. KC216]|uniref:ABC transporter ATP-binding protein n=1 Tax=Actinomadura sp. KC216 TaxID=2530370 RepID=UPI001FB60CE1|nr:ABC transporter ATP-binding protein [Actinomadura sp. KC216]
MAPERKDLAPQRDDAAPGRGELLRIAGLRAGYGRVTGVADVSVEVRRGELVAVLGPNGAGKSTVLRAVSGMIRPWSGEVVLDGRDVTGLRSDLLVRAGMVHVPEGRRALPRLTVEENLRVGAFTRRDRAEVRASLDEVFDRFPRLKDRRAQKAGTLSGGEQQMLVIGRALMAKPKLLLLDEPSLGLSPLLVREVFAMIRTLAADGQTVLLVEQNVAQGLAVADRGYVLTAGRVTASGPAAELAEDPSLLRGYLGSGE